MVAALRLKSAFATSRTGVSEWASLRFRWSLQRRDRLLLIIVLAQTLLHILGAAGEALGMSRLLKANTVKSRVHSLYRQAKPICNFSQPCPKSSPKSSSAVSRITASARQNLKTLALL